MVTQTIVIFIAVLIIMSEEKEKKESIPQIFQRLLNENPNLEQTKQEIKEFTDRVENHTFHAFTGTEEHYLQVYGLTYHEEEHFNYINQLLHSRTTEFLDKIADKEVEVKSTIPPPPPPPPQVPAEIVQEVEDILNNIDLPLSLFKRNDHYWSQDNAKTKQVKEYLKQLHDEDRKWKGEIKKKRQSILNEKNESYHKNNEDVAKQQQKQKQQQKLRIMKKIEMLKSQPETRKKTIEEGLEFMKKQGMPLFKKMEEEFHNKVEIPSLEERKRKLSEVRNLRKSVDLLQLQQHRQKYQKIKQQHEGVKIYDEPVKVSFKGNFYKSLEKSRMDEITSDSRFRTLLDKKTEYSRVVKEHFKPAVDQEKANEIYERIELMNKRFTRAKKLKKYEKDDDQEEEEEEQQEEPEPQPEPEYDQEQQEDQDEDGQPKPKDDQYQPTQQERYKMGLKFLEQARRKRKKAESKAQDGQDNRNKTFTVRDAIQSQRISINQQPITSSSSNRKVQYRNYLHQMQKSNKTIDHIDTSRIKKEFTEDMKLKQPFKVEEVENKIRTIQEKAKHEQELLRYGSRKKAESLQKKQQLDNVILDTIKARLALMKN